MVNKSQKKTQRRKNIWYVIVPDATFLYGTKQFAHIITNKLSTEFKSIFVHILHLKGESGSCKKKFLTRRQCAQRHRHLKFVDFNFTACLHLKSKGIKIPVLNCKQSTPLVLMGNQLINFS